ncbi:hypothetical protein [Aequorivita marina]|uniref:hypothetical protein n=1 Tax=Aequorivita marina TaxID=3073654 RepID=UPI00287421FF|nr:hypothetical protein [Aequorivita sp. S2608]MDS1296939.1 hypothetical protein [Aequorivita sp. S2608]
MTNKIISPLTLSVLIVLFFTACVKNTDFEQGENVVLTPTIDLNLIYFNLRTEDFYDSITATPILTLRDTTKVKFLDDSTLMKNLKRAEFYFKFTNSIPRDFQVDFQFLSEFNDTTYVTETGVNQGTTAVPVETEFIENVEGNAISELTKANKVVVSVTIPAGSDSLDGVLNLKSMATYYFEN